ncbi:MAG: sulfatase [Lentisphaerae bacterium]|nr:sulfatase [Lentisphaerota bacterium]
MNKPNVIIIFADDLGYGDLGCYGSTANATPRMDQMAQEGMRFTDFYATSPVCSPSRAALMTGCYPKRLGLDSGYEYGVLLPGDPIGLDPKTFSLPRMFSNAGYATKMIGKWHIGDQPEFLPIRHGFDSYFGLPYSNDMLPDHPDNKRFHFPPLPLMEDEDVIETDPNQASLTDRYTAEALRFVEQNARDKIPFFLYLAHMYVHLPIHTPMKYRSSSCNGAYGAAVAHMDQSTGCIFDDLEKLGIDDETLVIFTSDNGSNGRDGGSNAPLRGTKGTTWEGGMREPCIMRWPAHVPAGTVCSEITTTMDLLPTLATLVGGDVSETTVLDGHDISKLMLGKDNVRSPYEAVYYYGVGDHTLHAVRSENWKLHLLRNELYNLSVDIAEQHNVFAEHGDVVTRLSALADGCRQELGDAHTQSAGTGCKPVGRVDNPRALTTLDQMDPVIRAMYDLDDIKRED